MAAGVPVYLSPLRSRLPSVDPVKGTQHSSTGKRSNTALSHPNPPARIALFQNRDREPPRPGPRARKILHGVFRSAKHRGQLYLLAYTQVSCLSILDIRESLSSEERTHSIEANASERYTRATTGFSLEPGNLMTSLSKSGSARPHSDFNPGIADRQGRPVLALVTITLTHDRSTLRRTHPSLSESSCVVVNICSVSQFASGVAGRKFEV